MVGQISSPHPRVSPERTVSDAAPCERSAPGEASGGSSVTSGEAYLPPSPSEIGMGIVKVLTVLLLLSILLIDPVL